METGSIARVLGTWEIVAVCLFFMLLLPIIFFTASRKRLPRRAPVQKRAPSRARARPARPAGSEDDDETDERS
ncbi:MAG TPA: hypothetical protein VMV03_09765 [Spirochaetia bacterium]|nr:hypothetical protein [Spirochaetia bacterium]